MGRALRQDLWHRQQVRLTLPAPLPGRTKAPHRLRPVRGFFCLLGFLAYSRTDMRHVQSPDCQTMWYVPAGRLMAKFPGPKNEL